MSSKLKIIVYRNISQSMQNIPVQSSVHRNNVTVHNFFNSSELILKGYIFYISLFSKALF